MTTPRSVLLVLLMLAGTGLGVGAVLLSERGSDELSEPVSAAASATEGPVAVLRQWDAARARAWASADMAALRSLYLPGSEAAARDASMLQRWRERGLRVERMQIQVLAVRVVAQSSDRLVLEVTDRLALAVAAGQGQRAVLPADRVTTRRVTLRRVSGVWRMASVLPAPVKPSAQR